MSSLMEFRSVILFYVSAAVVVILYTSSSTVSYAPNRYVNHEQHRISILGKRNQGPCIEQQQHQRRLRPRDGKRKSSLAVFPYEYYDEESGEFSDPSSIRRKDSRRNPSSSSYGTAKDFATALAIVPSTKDWDRLQRARHFARDPVFQQWPPAIRLFHPFHIKSSSAFDVAQLVEDLDLEPFEITLDTWVLVPHVEAMQAEVERRQSAPDVVDGTLQSHFKAQEEESERQIRTMIQAEERKAAQKARVRNSIVRPRNDGTESCITNATNGSTAEDFGDSSSVDHLPTYQKTRHSFTEKKSPAEKRSEQQRMMEEDFGGPCVLCLEPNEESKQRLMEFREMLRDGLNHDSYFSPSSSYSWRYVKDIDMGFRPLIPISKFESFQSGMEVARRLKGLWGLSLTIRINDLHVLSCKDDDGFDSSIENEWNGLGAEFEAVVQPQPALATEPFGCSAQIMLVGQEVEQDDAANQGMVDKLLEEGEAGGMDITSDYTILDDEEEGTSDIERWLNDDEDFDEGTQVIIGRTHFFTGDQRNYRGMPATSAMDTKDRAMGESGSVSGLARRRGASSRSGSLWEEGEFGRRTRDFMPWGLKDRTSKESFAGYKKDAGPMNGKE